MSYTLDDIAKSVERLEDTISDSIHNKSENKNMDIAGLLALMQGNKGMDLPGLLALCKEKGYDRGWGGEGMFMFVFLLLFLFSRGGWNGLGAADQQAFNNCASNNCQSIIGLHDRISAAQAASTQGFSNMQTWLCEAIANVTNSIRNQGDRAVDATRNVGDTVRDCCCKMEALLSTVLCEIKGVGRDIRESTSVITGKIDLAQERNGNALQAMECRLSGQIKDLAAAQALGFERQSNLILNTAKDQELARLQRENEALKDTVRGNAIAEKSVSVLQDFLVKHYKPTNIATTPA